MPRRKGQVKVPKPGTFAKGAANPKFKHGLYAFGGREWIEKRDFLYKLSRSALELDSDLSDNAHSVDNDRSVSNDVVSTRSSSTDPAASRRMRKKRKSSRGEDMAPGLAFPVGPSAGELVSTVNALSQEAFAQRFLSAQRLSLVSQTLAGEELTYLIGLHPVSSLTDDAFNECFSLIEETSSADYRASKHGWHPSSKKAEMRDRRMQYILVHHKPKVTGFAPINRFQGFLSFMVDTESDPDLKRSLAIIYIYELHLKPLARGCGLGKHLVELAEDIGRKIGIEKTMLTVFTCNTRAETFYRRLGYKEDAISPYAKKLRNGAEKKPDYYILSKEVGAERPES